MIEPFAEFHFLRPLWLLLLLAIPLFWLLRHRGRADAGAWRSAIDPHLLPHLIERIDAGSGRAGIVLAIALWSVASFALAGPAWEREPMPLYRNQAARVLALELSSTMMAQDEKPSRFERARYKLVDILERSKDYQTALIGYAGEAYVAAPLTDDIGTVRNLVDALDPSTMPVAGNHAAAAIGEAQQLIQQVGLHRGDIIVLADSADRSAVEAARRAHAAGLVVSVLGVGSPAGAPVALAGGDFLKDDNGNVIVAKRDDASLAAVAEAGGGRYVSMSADASDIDTLLVDRTSAAAKASEATSSGELAESSRWRDRGPWLLLLLVPLAALAFRRGWLMAVALVLLAPAPRADAASLKDLWMRPDQQAAAALAEGDAKTAAGVARSPDWHGSASFRAGDFESAAKDYAEVENADGAYNQGNALAKLGKYEEALAAYDRALKLSPDMDDAKANKAAVEEWMKRQQKQDKPSPKQQSKQNGSKDKQQNGDKSEQQSGEQQDQDSQDQSGQQNQDQQSEEQGGGSKSDQDDGEKEQQSDSQQKSSGDEQKQQSSEGTEGSTSEPQSEVEPSQGKPSSAQQQALSKAIDQQLAQGGKPDKDGKPAAAVEEDDATQEKRQALDHLLQRVPDDPGGLLRRKFLLEHQRRMQHGDGNG
ncbi:MAG TPA: tetratricopeptide repeat protein [Rhodanobacteraceae bacterium]|nr:tetratricopeptide repeat protein [Rhodanobacteraceae bacterium]